MADVLSQSQFIREAPEIEAQKLGLLESAKAQVDATNLAASQGNFLTPNYQIAGMSGNQVNATVSALDDDNDATCGHVTFNFLDSPNTTSAISYKIMGANWTGAAGFRINQPVSPGNDFYAGFVTSTFTLMEIAG